MSTSRLLNAGDVGAAYTSQLAGAPPSELPEALIVAFDANLRVVVTARGAQARPGARAGNGAGEPVEAVFPPELWRQLEPLFRSALDGETRSRELWTAADGHCLLVDVGPLRLGSGESSTAGEVAGGVAVVLDVTARRRGERPSATGDAFEEVFERAPTGTGLLDRNRRWLLVNRALCDITGYTPEELIGHPLEEVVLPEDDRGEEDQRARLQRGEISALQLEKHYLNAAGERLAAIFSMALVRDEAGEPLHYIAQLQDISERKQLEERLRHLADHDPLTGLRNRRLFDHDLALQVGRCQRYAEYAGLVLLDLDGFKQVNDSYGHKAGDDTLRAVALALRRRLRETDLIARLGGDEFAVLLPHVDERSLATVVDGLGRVMRACAVDVGEVVLHPRASIGSALIDECSKSAEEVLSRADRAMYEAKRAAATG